MRRHAALAVCLGALATVLGGCITKTDPTHPDPDLPEARACPAAVGMISDGESANRTSFIQGRGGYWYTFLDTKDHGGSDIWPTSGALGGTFEMTDGGAAGSAHSARMKGKVGGGDVVYAGMGLNFVDPKGAYDASAYGGIAFWAKKNPGSINHVRLKVPDAQTDPDGKQCKQCFNDHGMDVELYDEWTHYVVPFRAMHQQDWGPKDNGIDPAHVYGVQFQVSEKNAPFDVSIDQIEFTGCR